MPDPREIQALVDRAEQLLPRTALVLRRDPLYRRRLLAECVFEALRLELPGVAVKEG